MAHTIDLKIKKLQADKPDSVGGYHLSVPEVTFGAQAAYPVPWTSRPQNGTICGISVCKVYPPMMLPSEAVGSYPTFSSFPCRMLLPQGSYFLWHYLSPLLTEAGYSPVHCSVLSGLSYLN